MQYRVVTDGNVPIKTNTQDFWFMSHTTDDCWLLENSLATLFITNSELNPASVAGILLHYEMVKPAWAYYCSWIKVLLLVFACICRGTNMQS
jgi:hypothetical protein